MGKKNRRQAVSAAPSANRMRKRKAQLLRKKQGPLMTQHPLLDIKWDPTTTLKQNYKRLGLVTDVNLSGKQETRRNRAKLIGQEEIFEALNGEEENEGELVDALVQIQNTPKPAPRLQSTMAIWEQLELRSLLQKYGDDIQAMVRDTTLNKLQRNKNQLEKRLALYKRLQDL